MIESIEEIASISQEAAAGVEQTSASTSRQTVPWKKLQEALSKLAEEMNGLIRQFEL
ncbi:hypothetical protein [Oceanobacillus sp. J11TS1]|uniref:hypothetical protein n=1 Tax=Oceanobacillus sp. J11TS1 TaxID=2807191 RepID=UPI001B24C99E|nr:hypothetical protein [Oceanobacillus sp. J11TS1]GIO22263.1 hypothetical protein J11TS1_08440 [Oceanobacillus sp. J11TS1]